MKKVTGVVSDWTDWTKWAVREIVNPIKKSINKSLKGINDIIFAPIAGHIKNLRVIKFAQFINDPHAAIRKQITTHVKAEELKLYKIFAAIRASKAEGLVQIVDDYLTRLDSIKFAVEALAGTQLPIIDGISQDIHTLLNGKKKNVEFPASLLALVDTTSGTFKNILAELELISATKGESPHTFDLAPGHFYDWVSCKTLVDKNNDKQDKKAQQRLRLNMLKVILSYIDNVDIDPHKFINAALQKTEEGTQHKNFGGFNYSSASLKSIDASSDRMLRFYAGIIASAFEHIFVSSRPMSNQEGCKPADRYHELPLSLKIQRPDLSKLAFNIPDSSVPGGPEAEMNAEFLAMKIAATSANVTAGAAHKLINCICNGIWEVSPNNLPLVDTIASMVAIPVYEMEKTILYDILRRFRIYITEGEEPKTTEFEIMRASIKVPNFSDTEALENDLTAIVAVSGNDKELFSAVSTLLGSLPVQLDVDDRTEDLDDELKKLLFGSMKDGLAVSYIATA